MVLMSEPADRKAGSIRYRMTIARLPHAGEAGEFDFPAGPVAGEMVRRMADGSFTRAGRGAIPAGGDGTGRTRPAVAIARSCIGAGARDRVLDIIEPAGLWSGSSGTDEGRLAEALRRRDVVAGGPGCLPVSRDGGNLLFHLMSSLHEWTPVMDAANPEFGEWSGVGVAPG